MGVRSWLVEKTLGKEIDKRIKGAYNVFKYEVPGKEYTLPRLAMFRQQEYKIWASGNPADLMSFYGTYSLVPGERSAGQRLLFWEWVRGVNTVPKLHFPAPNIIVNQLKSLIFADDLDIEVVAKNDKGERLEEESIKLQDELMAMLEDNDANEKYQTGVGLETYSGSLAYRFVYNSEISEYPIIIPYPAEKFKIRSTLGKIQEIIFEDDYKFDKKIYRLKSHYGKGYIKYKLYLLDENKNIGKQVPIETVPELSEGYNDVVITLDGKKPIPVLLAAFKKNRTQTNDFEDTMYGGSDFEGITDTFHLIDELYSQKNLYIRRTRPIQQISNRNLKHDKQGKEIIPKEWELDTLITEGDEALENKSGLRRDVPELNLSPYDASIKEELKNIWMNIGLAYTTVGLEAHSANQSGASLEIKERSTIIVRNNKIKLWEKFLKSTYKILLIFRELSKAKVNVQEDGTQIFKVDTIYDNVDFNIEFPMYNNQTFDERINTASKALGVAFDYEAAVEYALRNKYTEEEIKDIVVNMKIENGIPAIGNQLEDTIPVDEE